MAKKKRKQGFSNVLVSLGIAFTIVLFVVKIIAGRLGWLDVFAPVLIAFFIIFLLSILKSALKDHS